jgi:hypothetical protein
MCTIKRYVLGHTHLLVYKIFKKSLTAIVLYVTYSAFAFKSPCINKK